ncbi:2-oxoglutarate and iron-dependent oxygenase domain-containing protein [Streptomyces sp. NPDC055886]
MPGRADCRWTDFDARRAQITEELWEAATDIGFFQLVNHGIDQAFTDAAAFFARAHNPGSAQYQSTLRMLTTSPFRHPQGSRRRRRTVDGPALVRRGLQLAHGATNRVLPPEQRPQTGSSGPRGPPLHRPAGGTGCSPAGGPRRIPRGKAIAAHRATWTNQQHINPKIQAHGDARPFDGSGARGGHPIGAGRAVRVPGPGGPHEASFLIQMERGLAATLPPGLGWTASLRGAIIVRGLSGRAGAVFLVLVAGVRSG